MVSVSAGGIAWVQWKLDSWKEAETKLGAQEDILMQCEQEFFQFDAADYLPNENDNDDADVEPSDTDEISSDDDDVRIQNDALDVPDQINGDDEPPNDDDDIASLEHLSPYESDELKKIREGKIQKKKGNGKGKKKSREDATTIPPPRLVEKPTILEGTIEKVDFQNGYDTEYDSENCGSPVEDEEFEGEFVSVKNKYEIYNPRMSMWNFEPSLGMLFSHSTEFKDAIRDFAVVTGRQLKFAKNNKQRVLVRCKRGCPFRLMGGPVRGEASYQIRSLVNEHKCNKNYQVPMANANWLVKKFHDRILRNPKWKLKDFIKDIREEYGMDIGVSKACRARKSAKDEAEAGLVKHYDRLTGDAQVNVDAQINGNAANDTLQAPLKTRHERVSGGVGAYASDTGLAFIRLSQVLNCHLMLPGMKKGYWYKPGDRVGAPSNNQVMEALDGPPTTQPSQVSPSRVTRNSVAAAPIQPFFPPRQSAAAPTISSLAKAVTKPIPKSLGLKKSKAMDWLKDQTMEF
ncbi:hypothetical protein FRX31_018795 [Thalictrum thalictroides]|uniref:Transposase MuDR plant domain-containing protein n=1 Tax=Thalictrum thalictroides TaxID=46969 RepID=A0A7J6W2M4_THATH|nr:hypothetical protein FRX31_018795 [Thalictrum thalictroides]